MLKENWRLVSRIERVGDFLIIILAFFLAYYGRDSLLYWNTLLGDALAFGGEELAPIKDYFIVLVVALFAYALAFEVCGAYGSMRLAGSFRILKISIIASVFAFFSLAAVLFLLKIDLSRSFIALFCVLVGLLITCERYAVLQLLRFWRRRGKNFRNIVVCGTGDQAIRLATEINARPELGLRITATIELDESSDFEVRFARYREGLRSYGCQRIGRLLAGKQALLKATSEQVVDEVVFTDVVEVMPIVEELVIVCAEQGIRTTIAADLFSIGLVKSGISYFGSLPLIHFQTPPGDRWELVFKRYLDIVISAISLIVLSPLLLAIALLIKATSHGPVLFAQKRVGLNGRAFDLYKFRSMRVGAEQELEALRAKNEMEGPVFKMAKDPRVTPFGQVLRRYSLDELPQLWNVLRGDMSLVGPRPPVPGEVSLYERKDRRRLSMRPGMTCIWQVSGRNNIKDFESWVKLDLQYIDNWSLALDFILLFKTIPAVFFGSGAR